MFRFLFALFWVSLIIGTLVAHSVVANWCRRVAVLICGDASSPPRRLSCERVRTPMTDGAVISRVSPPEVCQLT